MTERRTGAEAAVTRAQALSWCLERQLLDPVAGRSAADVVGRLGAVLSMDPALAELAVRTRQSDSAPGDLAVALDAGEVVEAFAFRGSMHYLTPEDGGIFLSLRCAGRQWELTSWVDHYGLAAGDWPDFRAAVRAALADGPLTIPELGQVLAQQRAYRHLLPVFEDGAGTLVKPLSWQGDLCLGRSADGRRVVRSLEGNPRWRGVPDLDEAGPRAVLHYLGTYGPATPEHVHHWLGAGLSAGRRRIDAWIAGLGDRLVPVDVEGTTAHVAREDVDPLLATVPSEAVRLLPGHDQWVMGPGTKDTLVTPAALRDLMTRKANPVVVGGAVCGTWARRRHDLVVTWLADVARPDAAIEEAARRCAGLLGEDLRLVVT